MNIISTLLRQTALPFLLRRDGRSSALRHWQDLEISQYAPPQELSAYQWERLAALLRHAYETVPYYRRVFDERGLRPQSFQKFDDLCRLPLLTREMIRVRSDELFSSRFTRGHLQQFGTGGTTRRQMHFYRDQESFNIKAGAAWRFEGFMGRKPCDKLCFVWPVHIDLNPHDRLRTKVKNRYLSRELMFHVGAASEELLERYYRTLCSFRPHFLKGFPNALDRFAEYLLAKGYQPPAVRGILSTGETLLESHREKFQAAFGGPTINMYGSREVGNTACECNRRQGLHVAAETSFVEILADGRAAPPGTEGEIVVTDLTNYGFPLIRYAIEDHGAWVGAPCSCGRTLPLMSHGVGRLCDKYIAPDGTKHSILAISAAIGDGRLPVGPIQYTQRSLSNFHLLVTNDPPVTNEVERHIRETMRRLISPTLEITIEPIEELPREPSGKLRYCICKVEEPRGLNS